MTDLARVAFRRYRAGKGDAWMTVALVAGAFRLLRRVHRSEAKVVYSEELRPGESMVITHSASS